MSNNIEIFKHAIQTVLTEIGELLVEKNIAYGNSVYNPIRIFSDVGTEEQICVRIDDKLSRLARGQEHGNDDTVIDLLGYLVLLRANKIYNKNIEENNKS